MRKYFPVSFQAACTCEMKLK